MMRAATATSESPAIQPKTSQTEMPDWMAAVAPPPAATTTAPPATVPGLACGFAGGVCTGLGESVVAGTRTGAVVLPSAIDESSARIASRRPAQPSCLSTTSGSNTPSRTYLPFLYWSVPDQIYGDGSPRLA